jgi:hypothetical protein
MLFLCIRTLSLCEHLVGLLYFMIYILTISLYNLFPMFHFIVLNIIYTCVCARLVDIIICVLFVEREQFIGCDNFLSNLIAVLFCNKIILN